MIHTLIISYICMCVCIPKDISISELKSANGVWASGGASDHALMAMQKLRIPSGSGDRKSRAPPLEPTASEFRSLVRSTIVQQLIDIQKSKPTEYGSTIDNTR